MEWLELTVQIASLIAIILAIIGLVHNNRVHKRQSNAQIFLEYTGRYERIMSSIPADAFHARLDIDDELPPPSNELSLALLRYLNMCSEEYYLWRKGYLDTEVWRIWERELRRTLASPLFVREWRALKSEFESYPEFAAYVEEVQRDRSEG